MKILVTFVLSSLLIVGTVTAQSGSRAPAINQGSGTRGIIQSAPLQGAPIQPSPLQGAPAPIQSAPIQGAPAGSIGNGGCSSCNGGAIAAPAYSSGDVMSFSDASMGGDCGCGGGASFDSFGGGDCGCGGGADFGGYIDEGGCGCGGDSFGGNFGGGSCSGCFGGKLFGGGLWNRRPMFGRLFGGGCGGGCGF